jgi:hypothetical protein
LFCVPAPFPFQIGTQPDDSTCGPTCLHAVFRHFGLDLPLEEVIREVPELVGGGTLGAHMGKAALARGFRAALYTYDLRIFDPTWAGLSVDALLAKLEEQARHKPDPRLRAAIAAYTGFLRAGGEVRFADLSPDLLERLLDSEAMIVTSLSATYLYGAVREVGSTDDDVRGFPVGHFVVLVGADLDKHEAFVADPLGDNPTGAAGVYQVPVTRLICSILLGVLSYDGNLLVIAPGDGKLPCP